jgi:NAD+ synthase (glutamine-hydrolysing)
MQKKLRIALAQVNSTVGDLKGNAAKIMDFMSKAAKFKADIVTFPELAVTGYPPEDLLFKEYFVRDNIKTLNKIIKNTVHLIAIVGFVDQDKKGNIYNAAAVIKNGRLKGVYHKIDLPNYEVFDEKRYFQPGNFPFIFEVDGIKFGVNICEDIWKTGRIAKLQANLGANLIFNISSSPYYAGKINLRKRMLAERTRETGAYICYNNLVGGQDELVFDGGSMLLSPAGKELVYANQFEEDLVITDIAVNLPPGKIKTKHCLNLGLSERGPKPALLPGKYKKLGRLNEIYRALVLGTGDYVRKNGFKKVAIGLSGGIDSALTAVIACDAIGRENVIGISMPSLYSSAATQNDARSLSKNLGIKFITVPIKNIFETYLKTLAGKFAGLPPDTAEENLQARIRGNILMAMSNKFGWLVLTTGNKSELSVGYATLYGDMAGGFAVIKDVPKTLVYELARMRNKQASRPVIPQTTFTRPPTAELRENQKDSDSLPPYPVLDAILKQYVENDRSFEEIINGKFNPGIVKEVIRMVDRNEYKRRQSPPGIKITPKAFGKDRRLPITNRYKEYQEG